MEIEMLHGMSSTLPFFFKFSSKQTINLIAHKGCFYYYIKNIKGATVNFRQRILLLAGPLGPIHQNTQLKGTNKG